MQQSKKLSFIETCTNTLIGYMLANAVWIFVVNPAMFGGEVSLGKSLAINAIFTAVSIIRGYVIRRFFATSVHNWVDRTFGD